MNENGKDGNGNHVRGYGHGGTVSPGNNNYNRQGPNSAGTRPGGRPNYYRTDRAERNADAARAAAEAERLKREQRAEAYRAAKRRVIINRIIFGLILALILILLIVGISKCSGNNNGTEKDSEQQSENIPAGADTEGDTDNAGAAHGGPGKDVPIKICIDPGHGYDDPGTGAESKYMGDLHEKDINLAIGLKVYRELQSKGYNVIITHEDDEKPSSYGNAQYLFGVQKRMKWVEEQGDVNVFLSVHCNSYPKDESVRGIRVYYCKDNVEGAGVLANAVAEGVYNSLGLSSVPSVTAYPKAKAYYVTRAIDIPAVLIEVGFVTNKDDVKNMTDDLWQGKMAKGIVKGIENYISKD